MNFFDIFKHKKETITATTFPFPDTTESERLLLSFYAITDSRMISESMANNYISSIYPSYKNEGWHVRLYNKGIISRFTYMFEYMEFSYVIAPWAMIPIIVWLYETDEGNATLVILRKIAKTYNTNFLSIQIPIIDYIRSGFTDTTSSNMVFANDAEYLLPVITDERFLALLTHITNAAFKALYNRLLSTLHKDGTSIDATLLISLVKARNNNFFGVDESILNSANLYSFLTTGNTEHPKECNNENSTILKAVIELYKGNHDEALKLFQKALNFHNVQYSTADKRGYFSEPIVNFLWIACCSHCGSNEAKRSINAILKRSTKHEEVKAAWTLAAILTNKKGYVSDIRLLFTSASPLTRQLIALAVRLTGRNDILVDEAFSQNQPEWLLLKYETDKYSAMPQEEKEVAEKAYGSPQVSSIYMKQHWEFVLESLSNHAKGINKNEEKTERIGYFIRDINDINCEVRIQTTLKSGGWSAGKAISHSTFMYMSEKDLSHDDIKIRNRNRNTRGTNYINLKTILEFMKEESRLYIGRFAPYTLMRVVEDMPYLIIERSDNGFNIKSNIAVEDVDEDIIITSFSASEISYLKMTHELRPYFSQLLELGTFPPYAEDTLKKFLDSLRGKVEVHSELIEGGSTLDTVKGTSSITIQMRPQGKEAYLVSIFSRPSADGNVQCVPGEGSSVIIDVNNGKRACIERDLDRERELYYDLVNGAGDGLPPEKTFQVDAYDLLPLLDFVRERNDNYIVEWPEGQKLNIRNRYTASQWSATLKKNKNGWFEMEGSVQLDENTMVSISQLMDLIGNNRGRYIRLSEGEYIALSDRLRRQLSTLDAIASRSRNKLQMSPFSAALLDSSIVDGELHLDVDPELREIRQRIIDSADYSPEVPDTLNATLRSYQKEGYQWMARLNSWGAGALLADDMGLGKTIQTITYLLSKAEEGPALVVAPASVAPNWATEFKKFAPSLNVMILNFAQNRTTCIADAKAGDVVITTYGLLLSVKEEITKKKWTTVCLDEAHVIKNRGAKTSGVAMQLKSQYRIMLTGTPVQNHLGELWNLFQFVNPGLLGSYEDFGRRFITPIEVGKDKDRQKELDRIVHPFMLRRTKEKVLNELPEKTEIYQTVELSKEELAIYEVIRQKAEDMLEAEDSEKVSVNTLAEITRLRQAACSAQLIEKTWKGKVSKAEALIEALEPIVESGDAALVFSQFTSFLTIIQKHLKKAKVPYLYIDGSVSVKERQTLVEKFQNGECPVFLISLKAGGLGLNLTRANYVFHLDPWWNPAIEQQATDRAYRIGQHNAVTVYHFLAANTIEEKIRRLHEQKRDLADNILDGTDMSFKLTGKELLEMVQNS